MPPSLLLTNFGNVDESLAQARTMKGALTGHPHHYFNPLPGYLASLEQFGAVIDRLQAAHEAVQNRELQKMQERNDAHAELKKIMTRYVQYAELVADGDVPLLQSLGMRQRRAPAKSGLSLQVAAPQLTVSHAGRRTVTCKSRSVKGAFSYQVQFTDGDPSVEANWKEGPPPSAHASNIEITGLTSGREHSFRMRAIGSTQPGPWSATVTIMVL
jgi:hypothetical protein